ncbi:hypothetical protein GPROT2_00808 [Gammaproteobacteria bacterium]|nr:hypothetical protein GPROT2_00808 [Gammaproteobacteria bacterium]
MPARKATARPGKQPVARRAADHRTRVARQRRERTRERILESALHVFAAKGPVAPVIDDFISATGIARGTFYNYYRSTAELFDATARWLEDDLIVSIVQAMAPLTDPGLRVATGLRLWLLKARSDRAWCAFIFRSRYRGALVEKELMRDLRAGLRGGQFSFDSIPLARDFVVGATLEGMGRLLGRRGRPDFDGLVVMILRGLGMREAAIRAALARPLPAMRRPSRTLG